MAESGEKCYEFLNPNAKTVVVFNREILAADVTKCIKDCVEDKICPENSNVIILSGHHTSSEGKLGETTSSFTGNISTHLEILKGELGKKIKDYRFSYVFINTIPTGHDSKGNLEYSLAGLSIDNLKSKFEDVIRSDKQNILIFATCFSKKSEVNDLISACGLYPALFLSAEMGLVTGGKHFKLDKKQRSVIEKVTKVPTLKGTNKVSIMK